MMGSIGCHFPNFGSSAEVERSGYRTMKVRVTVAG